MFVTMSIIGKIKADPIKTSNFSEADVSGLCTLEPICSACKQHWTVSLHSLDCQCSLMILWSSS